MRLEGLGRLLIAVVTALAVRARILRARVVVARVLLLIRVAPSSASTGTGGSKPASTVQPGSVFVDLEFELGLSEGGGTMHKVDVPCSRTCLTTPATRGVRI
jgi:hypothetical protein